MHGSPRIITSTRAKRRGGWLEEGRTREERKPGYQNYCGNETCATAAFLNEDRENVDNRSAREKSGGEIEKMRGRAEVREEERETAREK